MTIKPALRYYASVSIVLFFALCSACSRQPLKVLPIRSSVDKHAIHLEGKPVGHLNAGQRRNRGLVFVPEERLGRGAVPPFSLSHNALLTAHRKGMKHWGLVRYSKAREFADKCVARFDVRCGGSGDDARSLSGGNLQKFIGGREIMLKPKVMIVAQPTWGVDVGASAVLRQALLDLSRNGVGIVLISEELEELFEISDQIAVLAQGRLSTAQPRGANLRARPATRRRPTAPRSWPRLRRPSGRRGGAAGDV